VGSGMIARRRDAGRIQDPRQQQLELEKKTGGGRFMAHILAKERIVAGPGFNRWLVPPAALCIHLCIGMAYGFSVFWLPLTRALGVTTSIACPEDMSWIAMLFTTTCDW